jgi:DNA-directed RNA polymerase subunit RPC12/RpoP
MIPTNLVKQLLDPWTETKAIGCVSGIVCPNCSVKFPPVELASLNLKILACSACGRSYTVQVIDSPIGKAFRTEGI